MSDFDKLPPQCDVLCKYRKCLRKGYIKGHFVQGRGYTSYFKKPKYTCETCAYRGCPLGPTSDRRSLPDRAQMMSKIRDEIIGAKCTARVRKQLFEYADIIDKLLLSVDKLDKILKSMDVDSENEDHWKKFCIDD